MKRFTRKQLEKFDGKEGRPSHAAVDGKVYDLSGSDKWVGGKHMEKHHAGHDLTAELANAPHGDEVFERVSQAGVLEDAAPSPAEASPAWAMRMIGQHPHPISVHFPQAFFTFAPVFMLLAYYFDARYFERTAFYLLCLGFLMTVPAILTGFLHWVYKFGRSTKPVFKFKIVMSGVLLAVACVTLLVHWSKGHVPTERVDPLLLALYVVMIPVVVSIGRAGGKIVFGGGK